MATETPPLLPNSFICEDSGCGAQRQNGVPRGAYGVHFAVGRQGGGARGRQVTIGLGIGASGGVAAAYLLLRCCPVLRFLCGCGFGRLPGGRGRGRPLRGGH